MNRKMKFILCGMLMMLGLTGCGTTELEERCFPQLVTVGYEDDKVRYYVEFPQTGTSNNEEGQNNEIQVPITSANSFEESRKEFESHLNKLADYNHLKVLVLEEDFIEEQRAYEKMIDYLSIEEDFPRNTYVCVVDDMEDLLEIEKNLPQDIGTYLELYLTNHEEQRDNLTTLGNLMDERINQKKKVSLPYLEIEDQYVEWRKNYTIGYDD